MQERSRRHHCRADSRVPRVSTSKEWISINQCATEVGVMVIPQSMSYANIAGRSLFCSSDTSLQSEKESDSSCRC